MRQDWGMAGRAPARAAHTAGVFFSTKRLLWNANELSFRALRRTRPSKFPPGDLRTSSNFKRLFSSTKSSAFLNQSTKPEEPKRFVTDVLWTRSISGVVHPNAYLVVTRDTTYAAAKLLIYHSFSSLLCFSPWSLRGSKSIYSACQSTFLLPSFGFHCKVFSLLKASAHIHSRRIQNSV
ncbi:hypothetical protein PGTUg99_014855 [Puccinia graminis f. sp. tritici]|uniref:Uncharacterized protein n=1 Tax=Puccinia graminis f. sp. tritici TaxID=56615 RepID=A0A5B0MP59_PUCGR|nr:hypothetical protein PGTUg99_014855 [Puccinia graminis f. sp. tritici]